MFKDGKAIGVSTHKVLTVLTKKDVVSAGSINSPALLRSDIKNNNIGKNLHVHLVLGAYGVFSDRARD